MPTSINGISRITHLVGAAGLFSKVKNGMHSSSLALFAQAFIANPRAVGAICPSSARLARALAEHVGPIIRPNGLILELGGGTGMVTAALLKKGIDPSRLVVVEQDRLLARHLKSGFQNVSVIQGNAVKLCRLCNRYGRRVETVVSSLPLLSLHPDTVDALGRELQKLLGRHGALIQYTYRLLDSDTPPGSLFSKKISSRIVLGNLPPARIDVYQARH